MTHRIGFRITSGKGFHVGFPNGYTVSVQFGGGNYCANYSMETDEWHKAGERGSVDAETAVWGPDGEFVKPPMRPTDNDVQPHMSADEVLALLHWAAAQPASATVAA